MRKNSIVLGLVFILAGLFLSGCREDEQNRALKVEKGTYAGKADQALSEEEKRKLQARGYRQKY